MLSRTSPTQHTVDPNALRLYSSNLVMLSREVSQLPSLALQVYPMLSLHSLPYENHLTIRTSIIGHELKKSLGLLEWFLSQQNDVVGFSNAIFSGLTTLEVAKMLHHYVFSNENISGLYHVASTPISKYELLKLIGKFYKTSIKIHKSAEPKINRSLDQSNFFQMTNYKAPPWEEMICDMYNWGKK